MNLGVRIEDEFLPAVPGGAGSRRPAVKIANPISFGWGDKIAPRIGGAWDVLGNGRWKIASSWVRVNDVLKYELARGSFGGDYWHDHVYTLDNPDLSQLSLSNSRRARAARSRRSTTARCPSTPRARSRAWTRTSSRCRTTTSTSRPSTCSRPQTTLTVRYTHKHLRYGIEDIGVLDENESEVYTIGNPGFGATPDSIRTATGASLTPKAQRDYDGLEFRVTGRMTHFFYNASYTYSKLFGNWSGLANSDEAGRSDPNVSRAFDLSPGNFDENGHNVYGRLATDRPHTPQAVRQLRARIEARHDHVGGFAAGLQRHAAELRGHLHRAGASTTAAAISGRTPTFTQTDLLASHAIRFGGSKRAVFEFYVFNLFNQDTVTNVTTRYNRNGSMPSDVRERALRRNDRRRDPASSSAPGGASPSYNPIYNQPLGYQEGAPDHSRRALPVLGPDWGSRRAPPASRLAGLFHVPEGLKAKGRRAKGTAGR